MIKKNRIKLIITFIGFVITTCQVNPEIYKGKAYSDGFYKDGGQSIPGKLQCEYYDFGGEGVAFHDTITVHTKEIGQMNYDYINFKWVK